MATTNHPERLDPAILDRPSRFDRKYEFKLPDPAERRAYLALWSDKSEPALRLSDEDLDRIAATSDGFSFAYLKELWLSSMMLWIQTKQAGQMGSTMMKQLPTLREQMSTPITEAPPSADEEFDEE